MSKYYEVDKELVDQLYSEWDWETNPIRKKEKLETLKQKISPYEYFKFTAYGCFPFRRFREIYSLEDLFNVFEQMLQNGESIECFMNSILTVSSIEDIKFLSKYSVKDIPSEIRKLPLFFNGNNVFKYGEYAIIGNKFKNVLANKMSIEQISELMQSEKDFRGLPIRIDIDNIGELSTEKLNGIQEKFDVESVRICEKAKVEGDDMKNIYDINEYRQIREKVDNIIGQVYVPIFDGKKSKDKTRAQAIDFTTDYLLALQILDQFYKAVPEYDYEFIDGSKPIGTPSNSLMGLMIGKAICRDDAEILRNLLSCVQIESQSVTGYSLDYDGKRCGGHKWLQVKLGNNWLNLDSTFARPKVRDNKPSGDLFLHDFEFYGERKTRRFGAGTDMECSVTCGGHEADCQRKKTCTGFMVPSVTQKFFEEIREFPEMYKNNITTTKFRRISCIFRK